jgi:autotransporter-associated beta strand protein
LTWGATGGGGPGTWDTTTPNWFTGAATVPWTQNSSAIFGGTAGTVTLGVPITAQNLTFATDGYTITGNTLTLGPSGTPTFTLGAGVTATISSIVAGSRPLSVTGGGTLVLGSNNTYTGTTTISQGTLVFAKGALGGTVTLGDANTGSVPVALLANFASNTGESLVISPLGTGLVTLGTTPFPAGQGATTYTGKITLSRDVTLAGGNGDRTTFQGQITGTGNLTITGNRVTFENPNNNFVGNITIDPGATLQTNSQLNTRNFDVIPDTSSVTVNGRLVFAFSSSQTIDGLNGSPSGVVDTVAANPTPATLTVGAANGSGDYAGLVQDSSGVLSFAKNGTGTQILSGANTYSGGTTLSGGTLTVGNKSALGTGPLSMAAGTTLSFLSANNFTLANNVVISGDPFFTPPAGTTQTLAGVISDGSTPGTLDMLGPGTLALTRANTYTGGTTVAAGTLQTVRQRDAGRGVGGDHSVGRYPRPWRHHPDTERWSDANQRHRPERDAVLFGDVRFAAGHGQCRPRRVGRGKQDGFWHRYPRRHQHLHERHDHRCRNAAIVGRWHAGRPGGHNNGVGRHTRLGHRDAGAERWPDAN